MPSHLHLSSLQRFLSLQALPFSLHLHLHISCHSMCLVLLVIDFRLNTLTFKFFYSIRNTQFCMWIIDVVATTAAFIYFNAKKKQHKIIFISTNSLHSWLFIKIQFSEFTPAKNANSVKKHCLISLGILSYTVFTH